MRARSILTATLIAMATATGAADLGSGILVGGFVSQGYLNSEDNVFLLPNGREGSGAFNEAAVIVSADPVDRVRVGIQLMGRDFGASQDSAVRVDWAYGDYRWRDQLGLRAGRIKLPYGLYNQERDVDMLRTSVLLPQSVYSETDRNLLLAYEGVGLYGNVVLGGAGDLDYELVLGSLNIPLEGSDDAARLIADVSAMQAGEVGAEIAALYGLSPDSVTAVPAAVADAQLAVPRVYGGSLIWNTPLSGFAHRRHLPRRRHPDHRPRALRHLPADRRPGPRLSAADLHHRRRARPRARGDRLRRVSPRRPHPGLGIPPASASKTR